MILQKLMFPDPEVCSRQNMYYKGEKFIILGEEKQCLIPKGEMLSAHTYFNCFSIGKWKKYTIVNRVFLTLNFKGDFLLKIRHAYKINNKMKDVIILERHIISKEKCVVSIEIPETEAEGLYYFQMLALNEDGEFWGGAYETDIDEDQIEEVKIAVGICTFCREKYVLHNLDILKRTHLNNVESPLYGKLQIFISDNGKTLSEEIGDKSIHLFPNRNLGGAGGFTRALIEIKKVSVECGFTHILLMDDDIKLNPDSFVRVYTMLRLLKTDCKNAFIGGHMLRIDDQHIQSEAADYWNIVKHHPVKYNYNLERLEFLIKNEIEDSINYFGWWFCCMPVNIVNDNNLPLPIFIKRDDIEYGLRNGKKFITLNGICVWHEAFEYKTSSYLEYYYFRNMCIMNSRHRLSFSSKRLLQEVKSRTRTHLFRYRYKEAELSLLGIQHFLKGIDWLKHQDGELLNSKIMELGYKKEPISEVDYVFIHGAYEKTLGVKFNKAQRRRRKYTLNGWLLPGKKTIVVRAYQPQTGLFYRAKKVINYEEISNTAFVTEKDYRSLFAILKMYRQTVKMIKSDYTRVRNEYRNRYDELINIRFWQEYLFQTGEIDNIKSVLEETKKPKITRREIFSLLHSYIARMVQGLLFWLPVKKNRIMVYVHDRKGFTCNPKYIVMELLEKYGDRLEIIWVTMHPETCGEIENMGVKVVKSDSKEQFRLYLRTHMFISNDAFPAWALNRIGQKWMNTWHAGMNYKNIGYDYLAPMNFIASKLYKIKNRQPDIYLSGSEFFTKDTSKSFRLNDKIFVNTGLPRNDIFFKKQDSINDKVRNKYHIPKDTHLVIFAPTFRREMKSETYGMDFMEVCNALRKRFGGEWILLFRNHNFIKGKQKHQDCIDVSDYHDMQELMYVSDVLISDYSSCLYDFCMTKRPAFVYANDFDNYRKNDRSFAFPFEKWPYPIAVSNDELVECITNFNEIEFKKNIDRHLQEAGAYDQGTASEEVAKIIVNYCV